MPLGLRSTRSKNCGLLPMKLGRKVAAHAQSIKDAIRAGVDSIEHASLIDEDGIALGEQNSGGLPESIEKAPFLRLAFASPAPASTKPTVDIRLQPLGQSNSCRIDSVHRITPGDRREVGQRRTDREREVLS